MIKIEMKFLFLIENKISKAKEILKKFGYRMEPGLFQTAKINFI
jgi:hypothetical protein